MNSFIHCLFLFPCLFCLFLITELIFNKTKYLNFKYYVMKMEIKRKPIIYNIEKHISNYSRVYEIYSK